MNIPGLRAERQSAVAVRRALLRACWRQTGAVRRLILPHLWEAICAEIAASVALVAALLTARETAQ